MILQGAPQFDSSSRWRSTNHKAIAFFHTRKAAGTTLTHFLKNVTRQQKLSYFQREGYVFSASLFGHLRGHLLVTSLREPIERLLSEYDYEGRYGWGRRNARKPRSLDDYIKRVGAGLPGYGSGHGQGMHRDAVLWHCVSDCQTKWFGGWWPDRAHNFSWALQPVPNMSALYEAAVESLSRFHVVVIAERLAEREYGARLAAFFNVSDPPRVRLPPGVSRNTLAGGPTSVGNLSGETLETLQRLNTFDTRLFRHFAFGF